MMVSLLGLSAVSALAQPVPEFFKLRSNESVVIDGCKGMERAEEAAQ